MAGRLSVVTGAFGYSGRHIAARLLARGDRVRTLTGRSLSESPFGDGVEPMPFRFDDPDALRESLRGADALVNTYWVRFDHGDTTHEKAVDHSLALVRAAGQAGVRRLVHVSITNPSEDSPLPYFRGKARVESAIRESGISHAILRPTVLFGGRDILVNNIAWLLRRLPLFGVPGLGRYPIQPIHVEDLADLAVSETGGEDDVTRDAVGPEVFSFIRFVRLIRDAIGVKTPVLPMPRTTVWLAGKLVGRFVRDVVLTRDEVRGLADGLLVSEDPPAGRTRFTEWCRANAGDLGSSYASELARHWRGAAS